MKFLKSENIYLRKVSETDVNELYLEWINNPDITKGLVTGAFPSSIEDLYNYVQQTVALKDCLFMAICTHDHKHIGNIKLDNFNWIAKTAELGILIGNQNYWGKGIGAEACHLLIKHAFQNLNLRKITLAVFSNNPAAIKLYEKIGFEKEGQLKEHVYSDGLYYDKLYMSIFKEKYQP